MPSLIYGITPPISKLKSNGAYKKRQRTGWVHPCLEKGCTEHSANKATSPSAFWRCWLLSGRQRSRPENGSRSLKVLTLKWKDHVRHWGPTTPFYHQTLPVVFIKSPSLSQPATYAATSTCILGDNRTYHGGLIHLSDIARLRLILSHVATKKCLQVWCAELREVFPAARTFATAYYQSSCHAEAH